MSLIFDENWGEQVLPRWCDIDHKMSLPNLKAMLNNVPSEQSQNDCKFQQRDGWPLTQRVSASFPTLALFCWQLMQRTDGLMATPCPRPCNGRSNPSNCWWSTEACRFGWMHGTFQLARCWTWMQLFWMSNNRGRKCRAVCDWKEIDRWSLHDIVCCAPACNRWPTILHWRKLG